MRPSGVEVNGKPYLLADGEGAFHIVYESAVKRRRAVDGTERGDPESKRDDLLVWDWDDWSGGEGQKHVDTRNPNTFARYHISGGAVDIRERGQIRLGLALSESLDIGATTNKPRLASATNVWAAWDLSAKELVSGTWTSRTTGLTGANRVSGAIDAIGGKVFLGTENEVRRVTSAGNTQWMSVEGNFCHITDNRLYTVKTNTANNLITLQHVPLQPGASAPFTPTDVGTIGGTDDFIGIVGDGVDVYLLIAEENPGSGVASSRLSLWRYDGDTLSEFARVPHGFRAHKVKKEVLAATSGIVFIGGYYKNPHTNKADPTLLWFTPDSSGEVGRIRERGNDERISAMYVSLDNQVLMGTSKGKVYAYNVSTGGIYEFASGTTTSESIYSFTYEEAEFFVAIRDDTAGTSKIYQTLASGTGKYPASVKVEGSRWDFDLPLEDKVLFKATVSGNFPASTSAEFSLELDDGSEITTDASGSTMTANTTGDTSFTLSNTSTERVCRWVKPNITLKTSDTSTTPIIYSVSIEATTATRKKFLELEVDLGATNPLGRAPSRHITGSKAAQELEDLLDSTNYIVDIKPFYEKSPTHPRTSDTYSGIVDVADIGFRDRGKATAILRVRL